MDTIRLRCCPCAGRADPRTSLVGARASLQRVQKAGMAAHVVGMRRLELSDEQREQIAPLPPPQKPRTGRPAEDHRRVLNGMLWVLRTGAPWADLPARYGSPGTVSSRFCRWRQVEVFDRVLRCLQARADARGALDWDLHFVDAAVVRAHPHAAGAIGRVRARLRRRRGAGAQPGRVLRQAVPARRGKPMARRADGRRAPRAGRAGSGDGQGRGAAPGPGPSPPAPT